MKKRIASSIHSRGKLLLVAICVSVGLGAFAVQALGSFGKAKNYAVGAGPSSVAIGDFKQCCNPDLAVTNSGSDTVSILLGNGGGSFDFFGKAKNYAVGDKPSSIAIGDFNRDGKRDLAVTNSGSGTVSILWGSGTGQFFRAATDFAVGADPESVAVGDFNGDGNPDLAVANRAPATVSILLGNGAGSFGAATDFAVGAKPVSVAVGYFNHDDKLDLATADFTGGTGNVSVLLGNGDGTFGPATKFTAGDRPASVAVGYFNNDRQADLAVANSGSADVSILLGNGDGTFRNTKNFPAGNRPESIAVGDLNLDRKPDLAVANSGSAGVSILLGCRTCHGTEPVKNRDGTFAAPKHFRVGTEPSSVAIGNLNAGFNPDLAVANGGSKNVSILLNGGPSPRTLTLSYPRNNHRFTGRLRSSDPTCIRNQRVKVMRRRHGRDHKVGAANTTASGTYSISKQAGPGTYYARVRPWSACRAENSKTITLRRH